MASGWKLKAVPVESGVYPHPPKRFDKFIDSKWKEELIRTWNIQLYSIFRPFRHSRGGRANLPALELRVCDDLKQ